MSMAGVDNFKLACVLFDLDGTLLDTAPDLLACLTRALHRHGLDGTVNAEVKPFISHGALAMIKASQPQLTEPRQHEILDTMLNYYQQHIAEHTSFFDGMAETLQTIEALGLKWGVVTNKRERFTNPLMAALKLTERAACIISGDTTSKAKPHPEPMLAACKQAQVDPQQCAYIGDAIHDIQAGQSVNMKTLIAGYGYLKADEPVHTWGADAYIQSPQHLSEWISACR
ncbi:MAG: HAD-IA family hydrolase [Methylococcales bacterium]